MEALAAAASFVAIGQALATVPKIVNLLRSIADIENELAALINELETLRATHAEIQSLLELFAPEGANADETWPGKALAPGCRLLQSSEAELKCVLAEVERLCSSSQSGADKLMRPQAKRVRWLWNKKKVSQVYERARGVRCNLQFAMTALSLRSQHTQSRMFLEIHQVTYSSGAAVSRLVQDVRNLLPQDEVDSEVAAPASNQLLKLEDNRPTDYKSVETEQADGRETLAGKPSTDLLPVRYYKPQATVSSTTEFIEIQTSLSGSCSRGCDCSCHFSPPRTSSWFSPVLGNLFLGCTGYLATASSGCSNISCRQSKSELRFTYHFPSWLWGRAVSFKMSINSMTDFASSLHLSCPRFIPLISNIWNVVASGSVARLQMFISQGNAVYATDEAIDGDTLLEYALVNSNYETADFLLKLWEPSLRRMGMNRNAVYLANFCLSHRALDSEQEDIVRRVIDLDADIEDARKYVLHEAVASGGDLEHALNKQPASLNSWNESGLTALHVAVLRSDYPSIAHLLRLGANPNTRDFNGITPLHSAVVRGEIECIRAFVDGGGDIELVDFGVTAMHAAAKNDTPKNVEILQFLLLKSPHLVNARDVSGRTPLSYLASGDWQPEAFRCGLQLLLDAGADLESQDSVGTTPLLEAIAKDNVDRVRMLVAAGSDLAAASPHRGNILHQAACNASPAVLDYLASLRLEGVDLGYRDVDGDTSWDAFRYFMRQIDYGYRFLNDDDIRAFVRLYLSVRTQNLQRDVGALTRVLEALNRRDAKTATCRLDELIHQKADRPHDVETFRGIKLQVKESFWDAAVESIKENISIREEEMRSSPWSQRSRYDPRDYWSDPRSLGEPENALEAGASQMDGEQSSDGSLDDEVWDTAEEGD